MKPNEKAHQLFSKFNCQDSAGGFYTMTKFQIKLCCIVHLEELLKRTPMYTGDINPDWQYLMDVKREVENL